MTGIRRMRPPAWFHIVGVLLLLWGAMGVFAFYGDVAMTDAGRAELPEWDRGFYATRPDWFLWAYGIATWAALAGSLMLLWGRVLALPLYLASLVAAAVQFGYVLFATDLIAAKGAVVVLPFPILILAIGAFQLWFAGLARRRGWIG